MARKKIVAPIIAFEDLIHEVRDQKIILDADLARIYGVSTKRLNEQVKRNQERFPADFAFQLTAKESAALRSQIATGSQKHRDPRFRPVAFTEHGAIMVANVLNSTRAVQMSVFERGASGAGHRSIFRGVRNENIVCHAA